ncbi:hypothetical protein CTAYLR_002563 [Chrysophaeum taylorii]|uniref:Eukaryotic rRNA processing n=1 Tax=Chrysophaeum taylorii TaxID=2483200 RepID=A0AAD7XPX6_9STRA|nr:hypothetical protein CTAYLR_002563 [Chrysophaeum taylorii]
MKRVRDEDDDDDSEGSAEEAALAENTKKKGKARRDEAGLERAAASLDTGLPWLETLVLESRFTTNVQDDLEREVAIYNATLGLVKEGKHKLSELGEPVERPPDFFCEMLKSDAHMARVKDELIFQQKKMEAFEQRKARQHQLKFAKAVQASKKAEKVAKKKEALRQVSEFRKQQSKKKTNQSLKDRKWGFGGQKKGRKKNDAKSINDLSSFDPRKGKKKHPSKQR